MSTLHVRVEIPKGSHNKCEWDPELQRIKLDRFLLFSFVVYPTDYGFVPETIAEDSDPSTRWSACPSRHSRAA